jgi:hypothetical protein
MLRMISDENTASDDEEEEYDDDEDVPLDTVESLGRGAAKVSNRNDNVDGDENDDIQHAHTYSFFLLSILPSDQTRQTQRILCFQQ